MYTAAVITVSDKGYAGERVDTGGPLTAELLKDAGYDVVYTALVPDEPEMIAAELRKCADEKDIALVATTGGTGFSPRDNTPEATIAVCPRLCPGIPEAMRAASMKVTPRGMLSRSQAGIRGRTLIINLPGSPKAIKENLEAVIGALDHGLEMLRGEKRDCAGDNK
jgi:molybdopterin adenylyltransferase